MTSGQRVLVVDGPSETGEVLKAVFEPRGLRVDRVRSHEGHGSADAPPHVVVLHADESHAHADEDAAWPSVPRVIIGSVRLSEEDEDRDHCRLDKPFQYRELIQAVERLLDNQNRAA
ncbi:MAG: hypothetical protein ACREJB_13950 [Planctomycetaceae bacterium]